MASIEGLIRGTKSISDSLSHKFNVAQPRVGSQENNALYIRALLEALNDPEDTDVKTIDTLLTYYLHLDMISGLQYNLLQEALTERLANLIKMQGN